MSTLVISSDYNYSNPTDFFGNNPIKSNANSSGFDVYAPDLGNHIYIRGSNIQYGPTGGAVSGTVNSVLCITADGQETLFNMSGSSFSIAYSNSQDWPTFGSEVNYWLGPNPSVTTVTGGLGGSQIINAPSGTNDVYGYTGNNTVVYATPTTECTIDVNSLLSRTNSTLTVYQGDPVYSSDANTLHAIQNVQFSDQTIQTSWLTGASILHSTEASEFSVLSEMYLAYFNRAPDALGLDFWAAGALNIHDSQPSLSWNDINGMIANVFAGTPEAISTFGTITSQSTIPELQNFVTGVYQNVLNRAPDQGGLDFWVAALHIGDCSPGSFIRDIINSVNNQTGTADKIYLTSKNTVAEYFAVTNGLTNTVQADAVMNHFNEGYNLAGPDDAIAGAKDLTDYYASEASLINTPQLIIHLAGINSEVV